MVDADSTEKFKKYMNAEKNRLNSMDQIFVYKRYETLMEMGRFEEELKDYSEAIRLNSMDQIFV